MLTAENIQWTNISSHITVSLAQEPSIYELHSTQYYTAEPADSIRGEGLFVSGDFAGVVGWCSGIFIATMAYIVQG
jgi:hypothetical protein